MNCAESPALVLWAWGCKHPRCHLILRRWWSDAEKSFWVSSAKPLWLQRLVPLPGGGGQLIERELSEWRFSSWFLIFLDFLFPCACWKILGNYEQSILYSPPPPTQWLLTSPRGCQLWPLILLLSLTWELRAYILRWNFYLFREMIVLLGDSLLGGGGWVRKGVYKFMEKCKRNN